MKLRHLAVALVAALLLSGPALAVGLFEGLPNSTSPGTAPSSGNADATGQDINDDACIPMDTGNGQGIVPTTMCVSPSQLSGYVGDKAATQLAYTTFPIGSVAYGSLGTNTTPVAGTVYVAQLNIPVGITIDTIGCLNGGTVGTDKAIYSLYDSTGALIANTALAGVTTSGTDAFQEIALTASEILVPGVYYVGWQTNGTTTRFRTAAASTYITMATGSATGTFGTLPAITVPTAFVADKGPFCYVEQ